MATTVRISELPAAPLGQRRQDLQQRKHEHLFIHTVRFWSMVAIVLMHAISELNYEWQPIPLGQKSFMVQPFKFATIAFFIISGFLVGDRLPASNPLSYLRRRASRLLPAWALWWALDTLNHTKRTLLQQHRAGLGLAAMFKTLCVAAFWVLTMKPIWFVPNLLVALTCLVLLRKWMDDLRLGALFLALSVFYAVNIYVCWIPTRHTQALFGFVFYLWLGAWCAQRKDRILSWVQTRSAGWLVFWACMAAGVSLLESCILRAMNADDTNTLRFGNQIYSVLVVILLVRIQRRTWPAFVKVPETTYGIYHSHDMVLGVVGLVVARIALVHNRGLGTPGIVLISLIIGLIAYALSLQLTRLFAASPRWAWAVGATDFNLRRLIAGSAVTDEPIAQPGQTLSNA